MRSLGFLTICLIWSALCPAAMPLGPLADLLSCGYRPVHFPLTHGMRLPFSGHGKMSGPIASFRLDKTVDARPSAGNPYPVNVFMDFPKEIGLGLQIRIEPHPNGTWLQDDGDTIDVPADGTLSVSSTTYRLIRFHFDMAGENRTLGRPPAMEWHFVFEGLRRDDTDRLAIVNISASIDGTLEEIEPDADDDDDVKRKVHTALSAPLNWRWAHTFVDGRSRLQHMGSMTTPPRCPSGVSWFAVDDRDRPRVDGLTYAWIVRVVERGARRPQRASLAGGAWMVVRTARGVLGYAVCGALAGMMLAKIWTLWMAILCCYIVSLLEEEMVGPHEAALRRRVRWEEGTAEWRRLTGWMLPRNVCVDDINRTIM